MRKKLPSAGHLILELQTIAQHVLGRTPQSIDITELSKQGRSNSLNTFRAVFGNFTNALKRARLTPAFPRVYDRETMLEELRALRRKLKRPLKVEDIRSARKKGKIAGIYHYQRMFGSVGIAIQAAGVGRKKYSRAEMIVLLGKLESELGRPIDLSDVDRLYRQRKAPSADAIRDEFGSFAEACQAAGIKCGYRNAKNRGRYGRTDNYVKRRKSDGKLSVYNS